MEVTRISWPELDWTIPELTIKMDSGEIVITGSGDISIETDGYGSGYESIPPAHSYGKFTKEQAQMVIEFLQGIVINES